MMISLISVIVTILSLILSRHIFKKWFNPLSIYSVIWGGMIFLYGLELVPYHDITFEAWNVIVFAYLSFLLGILLVINAKMAIIEESKDTVWLIRDLYIFGDDGKKLKRITLILAIIGLLAAIQHWYVLFNEYGSIANIFVRAQRVYSLHGDETEALGEIPYVWLCSYVAIFLSGIYSAYKGKFDITALIAILGVSLKSMATFTRSGILFGLVEFIIGFMLFRHIYSNFKIKHSKSNKKLIFGTVLLVLIMIASASVVKMSRETMDSKIRGSSWKISQFDGGLLLSPSMYFYFSSHIVALSRYLEEDRESLLPAQYTFFPIYRFLGKFGLVEKPNFHSIGYFTPTWTNTATYLRNLHSDFGIFGLLLGPFLIGAFTTYFWQRLFMKKHLISIVPLSFLMVFIALSFFVLQSHITIWFSIIVSLIVFIYFKKNSDSNYDNFGLSKV